MAGGMTSGHREARTLRERTGGMPDRPEGATGRDLAAATGREPPIDGDPRPCWATLPPGIAVPGAVLAWRRAPDGGWQGLVAAWLPAEAVRPRDPGGPDGAGTSETAVRR